MFERWPVQARVVVFLQPQSFDELRADKKTKLRKLFGEGSGG
jgi:hypothetical protein